MPLPLSESEIIAVKYYIGDVSGREADPFWGDGKAYLVLNSLLYPGLDTERARTREGKRLNPEILSDTERLEKLLRNLHRACFWGNFENIPTLYRVERYSDYLVNRAAGKTISFTSASTAGFLRAYSDRKGIALLRFTLPEKTPCIVMAKFLEHYAKAEESEVLLPPELNLHFKEIPLTEEEQCIIDADGQPPLVSVQVTVAGENLGTGKLSGALPDGGNLAGMRVYTALNAGNEPAKQDVSLYLDWKQALRKRVLS